MAEVARPGAPRLAFVDALKALACQLIVLHHLAFYGPMSDHASLLAPALMTWLSQEARIAVQVFLVIGGFLAVRSLAPHATLLRDQPLALVLQRYRKLVAPYLAAVLIGIVCAAIARALMSHDSVPGPPTLPQVRARVPAAGHRRLRRIVGRRLVHRHRLPALRAPRRPALAGARQSVAGETAAPPVGISLVATLALASLWHFNRDGDWDSWGVYFFASYALGKLSYWASESKKVAALAVTDARPGDHRAGLLDYRPRIAVALSVALLLAFAGPQWRSARALAEVAPDRLSRADFLRRLPGALSGLPDDQRLVYPLRLGTRPLGQCRGVERKIGQDAVRPARLKASRLSSDARRARPASRSAGALSIAYSPLT
jgi:hypothetical protein